jgi:hypothetical protein
MVAPDVVALGDHRPVELGLFLVTGRRVIMDYIEVPIPIRVLVGAEHFPRGEVFDGPRLSRLDRLLAPMADAAVLEEDRLALPLGEAPARGIVERHPTTVPRQRACRHRGCGSADPI